MDVMRVLRPGQNGTKQLLNKYGDRLLCVRYRYDYQARKRYKTVELIVSEQAWQPPPPHPEEEHPPVRTHRVSTREVAVRIGWAEKDLQQALRKIGGRWDRQRKLWFAREHFVRELGLQDRILKLV